MHQLVVFAVTVWHNRAMHSTPPSLLERLRQPGEQQAWDRFVQLYTPLLCGWARRLGLHDADIADLVQDVFLRVFRKLPDFVYEPEKSFRGWLRTMLLNHWRNVRQRRVEQQLPGEANRIAAPPESDLLEEKDYRTMVIGRLLALLKAEFPEGTWKPFWQYAVQGNSPRAVAQACGISINSVYVAKSRVLTRLRRELHGLLDENSQHSL